MSFAGNPVAHLKYLPPVWGQLPEMKQLRAEEAG